MSIDTESFTPPPPPRRGRSPWLYVGIGCGALTLLGFGGCAALMFSVANEVRKPIDKAQLLADMGDIPIYPGAQLDEQATQGAGGVMRLMEKVTPGKFTVAAFRLGDNPGKVTTWYTQKLNALGYSEKGQSLTPVPGGRSTMQIRFQKGDITVMVQVRPLPEEAQEGSVLILSRIRGMAVPER